MSSTPELCPCPFKSAELKKVIFPKIKISTFTLNNLVFVYVCLGIKKMRKGNFFIVSHNNI